jgi:hypothetical protein
MGNKTPSSKTPVSNPGRSGVFLFPNASTSNVPAFTPSPFPPGGRLYVGHVFPFPRSMAAVASLLDPFPWGRRRPFICARKLSAKKTGVDVVGRRPFRPLPVRPKTSAVPGRPLPYPGRSSAMAAVLSPFMRSTPTVGRQTPTVDPGRPRSDGRPRPIGRSRRSTTVDDPGRRPVGRNGNGGLRI